jgi:glycosyltransferase involved in cell wall biosynthesis
MSATPVSIERERLHDAARGVPSRDARKTRVLFVINGLGRGGAERQLTLLASGLDRDRFEPVVATLEPGGCHRGTLEKAGVPVWTFHREGRFDTRFFFTLVKRVRGFDIVHAWLTPGLLFGLAAGRLARVPVLVGTERGSSYETPRRLHHALVRAETRLLSGCAGVISNSRAGAALVASRGVPIARTHVVYNALAPEWDRAAAPAHDVRARLGIAPTDLVISVVASLTPKKDHGNLLGALGRLAVRGIRPFVLFAGDGPLRDALIAEVRERSLETRVKFLGERPDVHALLLASDVAVLPSKEREGCSNFLLEAMALGVAVVATDVGGAREIIENEKTGILVPSRAPDQLALALERVLGDAALRAALGDRARRAVNARFSIERMIEKTQNLYERWTTEATERVR